MLYINKYRQCRTEATTPRKYSSSMKKKAFICRQNGFEASLIYEFTEVKNQRFEFALSCCRTVVNKCCRSCLSLCIFSPVTMYCSKQSNKRGTINTIQSSDTKAL